MNDELTDLLKDRVVSGTSDSEWKKVVTFEDGSSLTLKPAESATNSSSTGGTVEKVELSDGDPTPQLRLILSGGATLSFDLADEEGSVRFQDRDGYVRYES